ncbi:MAG: hypothetical protein LC799_34850, partial [Actinobacteria bacterium]|nr:hypothetical protein [Actinomycetota bacterium]
FTGFLALILGMLAVLFGLLGWARARKGIATNPKMAGTGTVLGVAAAALGIWGMTIVFGAVDQLGRDLQGIGGSAGNPAAVSEPQAGDSAPQQLTFGQSFTYDDGMVVTIDSPTRYQPSASAFIAGDATTRSVAVKVTVVNGTSKPLDLIGVSVQATAGDQVAEQVFDSVKGVSGSPPQTLPPGQRQTFTVAFGLPSADPTDLRVQVNPSLFGYQPVFYMGQA